MTLIVDPTAVVLPADFPLPRDRPFTTKQAAMAGLTRDRLRWLLACGVLRRIVRGVFVVADVPDGLLLRARALSLIVPEDAVVTDATACWLHTGVLPFGDHVEIPPVRIFRSAGKARLRNRICSSGERTFARGDLTRLGGVLVTTPLRTALDVGRLESRDNAIAELDALLRTGEYSRDELLGQIERFKGQRGVVQLRELAPLADSRAESPGESVLRLRWLDSGALPKPTPQIPIVDGCGREIYRIDLGVEELRFGCEYDGEAFHSADEDVVHDAWRRDQLDRTYGWLIKVARRHNVFGVTRDIEGILYAGIAEAVKRSRAA